LLEPVAGEGTNDRNTFRSDRFKTGGLLDPNRLAVGCPERWRSQRVGAGSTFEPGHELAVRRAGGVELFVAFVELLGEVA
jgi:hypothetical protein